jgi:ribonuclease HI
MSQKKFYAVAIGRQTGIYTSWSGPQGAQQQVNGFQGARYKGFATYDEAKTWLAGFGVAPRLITQVKATADSPSAGEGPVTAGKTSTFWPQRETGQSTSPGKAPARQSAAKAGSVEAPQPQLFPKEPAAMPSPSAQAPVVIYTDGGCIGNPGRGGYGAVLLAGGKRQELSGGFRLTTNNRMELTACIMALQTLAEPTGVELYSDSSYVVNGIQKGWARRWRANGWMRTKEDRAENADLWEKLLSLCERHNVRFHWLKGHAGHEENERCDQLSVQAMQRGNLPADVVYEQAKKDTG